MPDPTPMDDEPTFDLMARDPFASALVRLWAAQRRLDVRNGHRPVSDLDQIERAERTAERMEDWRRDADEAWRNQPELPLAAGDDVDGTLYTPWAPEADKDGWIAWSVTDGVPEISYGTLMKVRLQHRDDPRVFLFEHLNWREGTTIIAYKVVS